MQKTVVVLRTHSEQIRRWNSFKFIRTQLNFSIDRSTTKLFVSDSQVQTASDIAAGSGNVFGPRRCHCVIAREL
jgi:hypothetical protein